MDGDAGVRRHRSLENLDLVTQLGQFFPLGCAQAFLAGQGLTCITNGLACPILNGLRGNLELPGELGWRSASANQFNYLLAEFKWAYLYRALDKKGHTIDFYLSATRNT